MNLQTCYKIYDNVGFCQCVVQSIIFFFERAAFNDPLKSHWPSDSTSEQLFRIDPAGISAKTILKTLKIAGNMTTQDSFEDPI